MKKLTTGPILLSFILISLISFSFSGKNIISNQSANQDNWYHLFDKKEKSKLAKAEKNYLKAKTYKVKADEHFKKSEAYSDLAENSVTEKLRAKNLKNSAKNEEKAIKYAIKAYEGMFESNNEKINIYHQKLSTLVHDTSIFHVASQKTADQAHTTSTQADIMMKNAANFSGKQQYTFFREAYNLQEKAVEKYETALAMYTKDDRIDLSEFLPKETKIAVDDKDSSKTLTPDELAEKYKTKISGDTANNYKPDQDYNVYKSRLSAILTKLKVSPEDSLKLQSIVEDQTAADSLMCRVDAEYLVIDSVRAEAVKEQDRLKRDLITQKSAELEQTAFVKLIKSAKLYNKANDTKYNFYSKYLPTVQTPDSTKSFKEAREYIISADSIHRYSLSAVANSKLQFYRSEEYLQLMDANQAQLSALQQQENAFSKYFGWIPVNLPEPGKYKLITYKPVITGDSAIAAIDTANNVKTEIKTLKNENKYEYNYSGSFVYTVENPKPDTLIHEKGTIYKVQVGVFKNLLSLNEYGKYSPISFDTYKNNPYKRFMIGKYESPEAAEYVLTEIKQKGIKDAYIVTYIDGKRTNYKKAQVVAQNKKNIEKANKEIEKIKQNKENDAENEFKFKNLNYGTGKYDFAQGVDINSVKGLVYCVQLGMYQLPKTNEELKMIRPLMEEQTPKGLKLMKGPFYNYVQAKSEASEVRKKGFENAFVTAYFDGQHISLQKAGSIESAQKNEIKNPEEETKQEITFSVQIGAYSTRLDEAKEKQFKEISTKYTITALADQNGLVIYTVGKYETYEETILVKNELRKMGFHDGFIIAFLNDKKITVPDAIKIAKQQN